jgi:mercuric ion transport protein
MARSFARQAYPVVAGLFAACAVIQVFLAGLGVFESARQFATHAGFGYLFGWLTLVMLVLALIGREPRRIVGQAALILVLFAMQSVFVLLRDDLPAIAALHPLNGFAILGLGIATTRASWRLRAGEALPSRARTTASSVAPVESL